VADEYLIFEDRAIQLYKHESAKQTLTWETLNEVMFSVSDSIRKYVLLAPMRIAFEDPKYQYYSDDLLSAISKVYNNLDPSVTPINAFPTMRKHHNEKLFLNTDYYWTARGAYYAAQAFAASARVNLRDISNYDMRVVSSSVGAFGLMVGAEGLKHHPETIEYFLHKDVPNTQVVHSYGPNGETITYEAPTIALSRRVYDIFLGVINRPMCVIQGSAKNSRVLLIVGDHYRRAFAPWLIPCFEKVIVIDPDQYKEGRAAFQKVLSDYQVTDFLVIEYGRNLSSTAFLKDIREACLD